jgi:hypothetical protein
MVNPDEERATGDSAGPDDVAAQEVARLAVELTEASDVGGETPGAASVRAGLVRRSAGAAGRTTRAAGLRTSAAALAATRRGMAAAAAAGRGSRAAGRGSRAGFSWLAGQVIAMGPRLRVRDQATLRQQFPGLDDEKIAGLLIDRAARAAAAVGATTGAWSALPVLPAFPAEIATETLAVVGIEVKLVAELHEILGVPAQGNATERARAYIGAWASRRGVYAVPGGLLLVAGSPLARQLRRRLVARTGRSAFSLGPLFTGAVAGAMINRRETRKLGREMLGELGRHKRELTARQ